MNVEDQKNVITGLVEMNESQKKEVDGGAPWIPPFILTGGCCGMIINVDFGNFGDPGNILFLANQI
jgi:hypothetical protein